MEWKRFEMTGLPSAPEWWRVRPEHVIQDCEAAAKGKDSVIATTPGGFPVHAVIYNDFDLPRREINWSSASGTKHPELYGNGEGAPQTVMIVGGVHGCEVEGVLLISNLMGLLETGRDWRGQERPRLLELAKQYRLALIPCVNMDGRAISPDHRIGAKIDECRKAGGGIWLDGSPIRWPTMKEYYPLPLDKVLYRGGYPNSAGYNIMHDATPGNFRTAEAAALCRLADELRVDFFLDLHSQPEGKDTFPTAPCQFNYPANLAVSQEYGQRVAQALQDAGFPAHFPQKFSPKINMDAIVALSCAAPAVCIEFPARDVESFEGVLERGYVVLETLLLMGIERPFVNRANLLGDE